MRRLLNTHPSLLFGSFQCSGRTGACRLLACISVLTEIAWPGRDVIPGTLPPSGYRLPCHAPIISSTNVGFVQNTSKSLPIQVRGMQLATLRYFGFIIHSLHLQHVFRRYSTIGSIPGGLVGSQSSSGRYQLMSCDVLSAGSCLTNRNQI